jgi:formylglycine-generating enzyme required for sulfatase activity/tRNA A-37 threonylcarbamoyl transferase component Bud32
MSNQSPIAPGAVIGGAYRIVRPLSEGGMGAVFVAEHVNTRKPRALKIMHAHYMHDPALRERFVQEAQIGARIESEHVVEVVDAGVDERTGMPWLAMELLEGQDLAQRIERGGPIPVGEAREIISQLCHALEAGHKVGIVHRDLKPENIFIAKARRVGVPFTVKVLDFGIAKILEDARTRNQTSAIGTPLWMAPEQTEASNRITPASDVWALGLVVFRMLTTRYYWAEAYRPDTNVHAILTEVLQKPLVPASQRAAELGAANLIPSGFDAWFSGCVDRDPGRRFPSAGRAFEWLATILAPVPQAGAGTAPGAGYSQAAYAGTELGTPTPAGMYQPPTHQGTMVAPGVRASGTMMGEAAHYGAPPTDRLGTPVAAQHMASGGTPAAVQLPTPAPMPSRKRAKSNAPLIAVGAILGIAVVAGITLLVANSGHGGASAANDKPKPKIELNKWVRIEAPKKAAREKWILGVDSDEATPLLRGFRPARKLTPPGAAFEIQQHEVTWGELEPWLEGEKNHKFPPPSFLPQDEDKKNVLPVTGVPWNTAQAYCKSLGGNLPSEEQWEFAARGLERSKFPWGDDSLDLQRTRAFGGKNGKLVAVMTSDQDKTDGKGDNVLYDMMGNAQEWTLDLYRDDVVTDDDGWAQGSGVTFRAVRGLPLHESPESGGMSSVSAAYREPVCASGVCSPSAKGESADSSLPKVLFRVAYSSVAADATGNARPALMTALGSLKDDLSSCVDTGEGKGALLKVVYELPLKKYPLCLASDGVVDPMNCCTGTPCQYGPHKLLKYDPVKVTVEAVGDPRVPDSGGTAGSCVQKAVSAKLLPPSGTKDPIKWPDGNDGFTAHVWIAPLKAKVPSSINYIGFRCVRSASKPSDD